MIAAIMATLKAGSAYVPLDPNAPVERLRLILADIRPRMLLIQRSLRNRLPELEAPVLCIDDNDSDSQHDDITAPPDSGVRSDDLAYIMYTSGSTGRPKGVMVEHQAICNTILWRDKELTVHTDDVVLNNLNYTFDPSLALIFSTLASGARIVLAEPGEEYDPHRLLERVQMEGVTILEATPALFRVMLDDPLLSACRTLRLGLLRRRGDAAGLAGSALRSARRRAIQPVRPDRDGRRRDMVGLPPRRAPGARPDRPADRQRPDVHPRCQSPACCSRSAG